jgi:Tfp pilus assembly protein PilX
MRPAAIFTRIRAVRPGEQGFALVMALGILTVLAISGTALTYYATSGATESARTSAASNAYSLAEAGLNDAQSVLYNSSDPTSQAGTPGLPASKPANPQLTSEVGSTYFWGTFDSASNKWTLYGTGVTRDPAAHGATVTRLVSHRVAITPGQTTQDTRSWNGLFANATTGCLTLTGGITVSDPAYVRGNLCISGGSAFTGSSLQVDGNLSVTTGSTVGKSGAPISRLSVAGTTTVSGGSAIYATQQDHLTDHITEPPVDVAYWYAHANMGPNSACTTVTGTPPSFSDPDHTQNWSQAAVNLTPGGTPYSCIEKDAQGNVVGQLTWNGSWAAGGTLTIKGVVFFDGPVVMNGGTQVVYSGMGTIYAATFSIGSGAQLCGISGCTSSWNQAQNLIVLVAGKSGTTGYTLNGGSTVQAAVYCVGDASVSNGGSHWGPITANQITISGGAILPKSLSVLPTGAPVTSTTTAPTLSSDPNSYGG